MSARKISGIQSLHEHITMAGRQARLELSAETISVHKNGIEFRSPTPFHEWTEVTVAISSRRAGAKLQCSGVVIACSGNKHGGYRVSLVFTNVSKQAQERLNSMARSELGAG
ncbi:MAG: PilZ domain-containing protein [Limisphaerales bacterium]